MCAVFSVAVAEQLIDGSAALLELAKKVNATSPVESQPQQPQKSVYLGEEYVNNKTLADVVFTVEGRPFYAHRIALLASSDHFKAMFNQVRVANQQSVEWFALSRLYSQQSHVWYCCFRLSSCCLLLDGWDVHMLHAINHWLRQASN